MTGYDPERLRRPGAAPCRDSACQKQKPDGIHPPSGGSPFVPAREDAGAPRPAEGTIPPDRADVSPRGRLAAVRAWSPRRSGPKLRRVPSGDDGSRYLEPSRTSPSSTLSFYAGLNPLAFKRLRTPPPALGTLRVVCRESLPSPRSGPGVRAAVKPSHAVSQPPATAPSRRQEESVS